MAGTDKSLETTYRPSPAIILCEPQLGENVGTTARAMANFGLWDLRLVNPRDGWPNERAIAAASRADHVIEKVRVFPTVEQAVADLSLVFATTARRRDMQKVVYGPEEGAQRIISHIAGGARAGLLFGRERWGLYNEEVALSDAIVTFPVEAAFASLNIAQAVLLMAYECDGSTTRARCCRSRAALIPWRRGRNWSACSTTWSTHSTGPASSRRTTSARPWWTTCGTPSLGRNSRPRKSALSAG